MSKKHYIIPLFIPHNGCPNDCVFCNQKKISGRENLIPKEKIINTIEEYLNTLPSENCIKEIAFYGGSFTGINLEQQKELLEIAKYYKEKGLINKIRLSTRPDYIDETILEFLKKYSVDIIELGVQSTDEEVLNKSLRGHTYHHVIKAVHLIRKYNFKLGLQMMIGLLGDNRVKTLKTCSNLISLKPDFVRIYPTLVVKGTYLEKLYYNNTYVPLTLEEAIELSSILVMLFEYYNIPVIRLGLQATENISLDKDVVAGPFHPSFRQLVEERVYKLMLSYYFSEFKSNCDNINFYVNKKNISNLVGHKKNNIKYLKSLYGFKNIRIISADIPMNIINITTDKTNKELDIKEFIKIFLYENNLIV